MPPLVGDAGKAAVLHGLQQAQPFGHVRGGQQAARQMLVVQRGVGHRAHLVKAAAHVGLAALRVEQGHVHRHAIAVDAAALGVGKVFLRWRAGHVDPDRLLHALRPQRVQHQDAPAGALRLQPCGGGFQALGGLAAQPGAVEAPVQTAAGEVVAADVAQVVQHAVQRAQVAEMRAGRDVLDTDHRR